MMGCSEVFGFSDSLRPTVNRIGTVNSDAYTGIRNKDGWILTVSREFYLFSLLYLFLYFSHFSIISIQRMKNYHDVTYAPNSLT